MNTYSALDVAKWFLRKEYYAVSVDEYSMTNLKVQKLLYYAQGSFLALCDDKIFSDEIINWSFGPVVEAVYHEFKKHGKNPIPFEQYTDIPQFTEEEENILESVYNNFGQFSAWKLKEMTHSETPWKSTNSNDIIPLTIIKEYFVENYIE